MRFTIKFISLCFVAACFTVAVQSAETPNISQLKKQCEKITPQQRQLAKAAGYNIDEICSRLESFDLKDGEKDDEKDVKQQVSRDAKLTTDERGVITEAEEPELDIESLMLSDEELEDLLDAEQKDEDAVEEEEEEELKPFGYEIFASVPTTFAPATDIATPANYIIGTGDKLSIQLVGGNNQSFELDVSRNGSIAIPELGSIQVSGLTFDEAKELIKSRVEQKIIGVTPLINLAELRTIRVFVLGEAYQPGSYSVSSLSTMTNAILVSGGITEIGSLRNVQLKRKGELVTTLDLYDLLLKGDTSSDTTLMPGDVIYIPPVGDTVSIKGGVKRPAIYEINNESQLSDVLQLAGGISSRAYSRIVSVERPNQTGFVTALEFDLSSGIDNYDPVDGDLIEVHEILDESENVITLSGHFHRPRNLSWKEGLMLGQVIRSAQDFQEGVDLNAGLIVRKKMPLRQKTVVAFSIAEVLAGGQDKNIVLHPEDEIISFDMYEDRQELLDELKEAISNQTNVGELMSMVQISGNVKYPGDYPFGNGMTVRDLIYLAGGMKEATYLGRAEISRRIISNDGVANIEHININLDELLTEHEQFTLQPRDKLSVYVTPEYQENRTIEIAGEVRFPGEYEFSRGETLSQVINRAGGFTNLAHVQASIFTREELREIEAKNLRDLQRQLEREVAASELGEQSSGARTSSSSVSNAQVLLDSLEETEALGRLIIQLNKIMSGENDDILLKDGDMLVVPPFRQEISVVGEVQKVSSHIHNEIWTFDDYIAGSGGFTNRADTDRVYVVRADGSIFLPNQGSWLSHQQTLISAGDTIVVPLEADRIKTLTLWTSVSQIVYQLALGAAAVTRL